MVPIKLKYLILLLTLNSIANSYPPVNFLLSNTQKSDVQYRLINNLNDDGQLLTEETVANSKFNRDLPSKFLIHGWTTNERSVWYAPLKNAYLEKGPHNVFYIDWSIAGNKSYPVSAANSKYVGSFIADFLVASKIPFSNVHLIGHSLGSHVAGFIGKYVFHLTGKKIGRITATDPSFPMFEHPLVGKNLRLSSDDAEFVDVIHTDSGHYGFVKPLGHADFYPNGGVFQPDCPSLEEDDNCSHALSNVYFIKSVNTTDILATECESWEAYQSGKCDTNRKVVFGENANHDTKGTFFLTISANLEEFL